MSDDLDDDGQHRLIIDDHSETIDLQSGKNNKRENLSQRESSSTTIHLAKNGSNVSKNIEPMDTSNTDEVESTHLDNGHKTKLINPSKKSESIDTNSDSNDAKHDKLTNKNFVPKKKKKLIDKSTCVYTKACQSDENLNLLSLKSGTTTCVNITILCKSGGNTLFILAKWKGREYHGVLSNGEHPMEHILAQKKNLLNEKSADQIHQSPDTITQPPSGAKARGKRGGRSGVDKKNKTNSVNEGESNNENQGKVTKDVYDAKICEFPDKEFVRCPHQQCGYRFETNNDVNMHMIWSHVTSKAVLTESVSTQTQNLEIVSRGTNNCFLDLLDSDHTNIDQNKNNENEKVKQLLCFNCKNSVNNLTEKSSEISLQEQNKSLEDLFKVVRSTKSSGEKKGEMSTKESNSPGVFSDISDDGAAPTLEKKDGFDKMSENASSFQKKIALNILTPVITGSNLDILSPVLSSSVTTTTAVINSDVQKTELAEDASFSSKHLQDTNTVQLQSSQKRFLITSTSTASPNEPINKISPITCNNFLTQQTAAQIMQNSIGESSSNSQLASVTPHIYMTPFQPNFFNAPFLTMTGLPSPIVSSQQVSTHLADISNVNENIKNFSATNAASFPSSLAIAAAVNGINSIPTSSTVSSSTIDQHIQKTLDQSSSNAQQQIRHKIYELKASQNESPGTSMLVSSVADAAGGRSSVAGLNLGNNVDSSSPLRPSSVVPTSSGNQRSNYVRQPTNSPNSSSMTATQLFNAAISGLIPPNLASSLSMINFNQQQALLNQQQQLQQLNQLRNLGIAMPQYLTPEFAQYAAILAPQMIVNGSQQQQQQNQQPQFSQPNQKP